MTEWPNSLIVPNGVTNYQNFPFGEGAMRDSMVHLPRKEKTRRVATNVRELFTRGEGISTPRARHKGRQPLIECANHDFNIIYFPFYVYFPFLCFLFFWGRQGYCPRSYVSSGAMMKSDLRSFLSLKFCWLNLFYLF